MFVAARGQVTLANVSFSHNAANGGAGGTGYSVFAYNGGGGGGMGGNGGNGAQTITTFGFAPNGGGGGLGLGADGGNAIGGAGLPGILPGASGGTSAGGGAGGAMSGGGAGATVTPGAGTAPPPGAGRGYGGAVTGAGGFGGGGGGAFGGAGQGGFGGGGGGGGQIRGGSGGFGGGGGASTCRGGGNGGFGAGFGGTGTGSGGGGDLGAGGAIFIQQGGSLTIASGTETGGAVLPGAAGNDLGAAGSAFGAGIFIQGNQSITFSPDTGQSVGIADTIADMAGSPVFFNSGTGSVILNGGGTLQLKAANSFAGGTSISGGGTLELGAIGAAGGGAIQFAGVATIKLDTGVTVANTIGSLQAGDGFDVAGYAGGTTNLDPATFSLTFFAPGGPSVSLTLDSNLYRPADFATANDTAGTGLLVTYLPCFLSGTEIATPRGGTRVERLRPGDQVLLARGGVAQVSKLRRQRVDCAKRADPTSVWPVRIAANAFGPGQPRHDLWLSPDHAVFVRGVLIPCKYLINGASVRQEPRKAATYFHVELPEHDILLAEALPVESYLDTGTDAVLGLAAKSIYPERVARIWATRGCAPLVVTGPILAAVRRDIAVWKGSECHWGRSTSEPARTTRNTPEFFPFVSPHAAGRIGSRKRRGEQRHRGDPYRTRHD